MAVLQNNSSGLFTAAGTWSLVDPTAYLNSETASTASTAAFVSSAAFTPGAITIDGIAIKVLSRTAGAATTNTFTVQLAVAGVPVAGTVVTINVGDIPQTNISIAPNAGWVFFKFAAPVLLLAATAYTVQIRHNVVAAGGGTVTLYRDGTAGNWSRILRTTTTQAPVAGDDLVITGEFTGAAANATLTVTMDETAATDYGSNVTPSAANGFGSGISICTLGRLFWQTTAATNYYLKISGNINVYTNGYLNIGDSGTPIPDSSTAKIEFDCTSNVQFGIEVRTGGIMYTYGKTITTSAKLTADAAAAATALTTDVSTGWLSGDVIALAPTTRTAAEAESKALTANAVGTALTITALTNAHSGTSPTQGELINLTRNIQIFGTSTTFQSYVNIADAVAQIKYTEFYNLGSATASKRGIDIAGVLNAIIFDSCSMHDYIVASSLGINTNIGTANNFTITNCVTYNISNISINIATTTNTSWTLSNCICIRTSTAGVVTLNLSNPLGSVSNITATGGANAGIQITGTTNIAGTIMGLISHSNANAGLSLVNLTNPSSTTALISTVTTWRNNTNGITVNNVFGITVDGVTAFGNLTSSINHTGSTGNFYFKNIVSNAGVTLTCPVGYAITSDIKEVYVDSSTFGATTTHATGDIQIPSANVFPTIFFRNCLFSSATTVASISNTIEGSAIFSARHNQTAGDHRAFKKYGTMQPDTVIYNRSSPSAKMTPSSATNKLNGGTKKVAVVNGKTATIRVYVRKSVVGDGAAYNGSQPRLVLRMDAAVGITSDVVLATGVSANGVWEILTGVTPAITDNAVFQFYLDCDGTTGWINVDDISVN